MSSNSPSVAGQTPSEGTTGTNGGNSEGNNSNRTGHNTRNGNRNNRAGSRNNDTNPNSFVPKLANVESLGTLKENRRQNFNKFQKSIHHHVMTTYKNSKDMSRCILEFVEPIPVIESEIKTLSQIRRSNPIYAIIPAKTNETSEDALDREQENADRRDMVKAIYSQHIKNISERIQICGQNMTVLWADIIGNCSPPLQEEISGDPLYVSNAAAFNSIWLLQTLQKVTAGANKTS